MTSQIKNWLATQSTNTRKPSGTGTGDGHAKRLLIGHASSGEHHGYILFAIDWTDVGKIISATLVDYTDDQLVFALSDPPKDDERPKFIYRRLTSAPKWGNNADGTFDSSDYTKPSETTSGQKSVYQNRAPEGLNRIDITDWANLWAPKGVKQSNGKAGLAVKHYGIAVHAASTSTKVRGAIWSKYATDSIKRPFIELVYERGLTAPNTPTNVAPSGSVSSIGAFGADFSDQKGADYLAYTEDEVYDSGHSATIATNDVVTSNAHGLANGAVVVFRSLTGGTGLATQTSYFVVSATTNTFKVSATAGGAAVNVTVAYSAATWHQRVYTQRSKASQVEAINARSNMVPDAFHPVRNRAYWHRIRQTDQEGRVSPWTSLVTFTVTNTDPNAPTLTPTTGSSFSSFSNILFRLGAFSDSDAGDTLLAYQVQMSPFPEGDVGWDEGDGLVWDTGKRYVATGTARAETPYGGTSLDAGTYYWRARQWDNHDGVSDWEYAQIILTDDFDIQPGSQDNPEFDPHAPWRIVIRDMYQADGVTKTAGRGPGRTVAVFEQAKSVGAAIVYNSPGDAHFTLMPDDPQISVVEPRQVHYSIQHYGGNGWRETFAGLVWDFDATETSVVFQCIDYLALYDLVKDERYDPANPDKPYTKGGSKYVDQTIAQVLTDQLTRAKGLTNSPVGFITIGPIAAMNEKITTWTTMDSVLQTASKLIDSHRQGQGKRTRIKVKQTGVAAYQVTVEDDPGRIRSDLRLRYGELVQGYRVIAFGANWASVQHSVGRNRDGVRVFYRTDNAPGIDQSIYGRIAQVAFMDGVTDENDLIRRNKQAAIRNSKLGSGLALGIRSGFLAPLSGYDVTDTFPVAIKHGAVDTSRFGSGFWDCYAVSWEAGDDQEQVVNLTLLPREDATAPNPDLIPTQELSPQAEWQIGWTPPDPIKATSKYWLDQSTGVVYQRDVNAGVEHDITASVGPLVTAAGHGFSASDRVYFGNLLPEGSGVVEGATYYVLATGLTADDFEFSLTDGGAAVTPAVALTGGIVTEAAVYTPITDVSDTMAPPEPVPDPTSVTVIPIGRLDTDGTFVSGITVNWHHEDVPSRHGTRVLVTTAELSPGTPDYDAAQTIVAGPSDTSATFTSIATGAPVYAKVQALSIFDGADSAEVSATPDTSLVDTTAPSVPTSLAAAAGIQMNLVSWLKVSDADLDHYDLAISTDGGSTFPTVQAVYTTIVALSGLTPGTAYTYKVRAVDHSGNASAYTSTVSATPRKVTGSGLSGTDIEALSIAGADIKANTITAAKIAAATITANEIAADTITAGNIAANAITSSELAANAVIAGKIAAGTIATADLSATCTISLVSNSGATVVIDSTGLTITNGKFTLKDSFGSSVMSGGGFEGSWLRFIASRVYNNDFVNGTKSTDLAVSETGGGSGSANYAASVSTAIPYWVVAASGGTLTLSADSNATGGFALKSICTAGGQTNRVYQDLPVSPGETLRILRNMRIVRTANDVAVNIYTSWRKSDHSIIGTRFGGGILFDTTASYATFTDYPISPLVAPANAAYLRYEMEFVHNTGTGTEVWVSDVSLKDTTFPSSAAASAPVVLTTSDQVITGAQVVLDPGNYLVHGVIDFQITVAGVGFMVGNLEIDGVAESAQIILTAPAATFRATAAQNWLINVGQGASGVVRLTARKTSAGGTAQANSTHSTIVAIPLP